MICVPAERAERIGHGVAALQQGVQAMRLLFQELNSLHLHPQHHSHLTLQAGELVCTGGREGGEVRGGGKDVERKWRVKGVEIMMLEE